MERSPQKNEQKVVQGTFAKKSTRKIKAANAPIRKFFSLAELPLMKKLLHHWLLAGIEDQHSWRHEDTVNLIYKMDFLMELRSAEWILHKAGNVEGKWRYHKYVGPKKHGYGQRPS